MKLRTLTLIFGLFISLTAFSKDIKPKVLKGKSDAFEKVVFKSEGLKLVGNLYYPEGYQKGKSYPTIIVAGSWTTVKEQMAGLYAQKLADNGFITLTFDFRNYGESEGEPRFWENPTMKVEDIKNAVTYLETLPEVDESKIGTFAVCAGSMYTLMAAAEDQRIKAVVTAASWLQDGEAVKLFYGGEEGVNAKITAAQKSKNKYKSEGKVDYIETISTTNPSAAMYGPFDYYLNPERGAVKEWSNDKFAVMSWEDWLTLDPMPYAEKLNTATLMIHSDGCVLPQYTKNFFEKIATDDKKLEWVDTDLASPMQQFRFYDQDEEVNFAVKEATAWYKIKL
ncbi:alpha/beta hydrolase [Flammeovirga sp. EKP202]|uniref:alpha/beta hydrolase n=1 Tax=Flammeovirga sp. EKP202 TaxID=2770592 RepID=UPI00165FF69E|nr:alpha/beta hydrolase [Flammeovirga sp. EKP202]MBD0404496.1 dienelactone hydrolase family protein [Flammeovirga sp. EKP202]